MEIKDFIGVAIAGLLSLLWFDLRSFRSNKAGYLKEEKHELLCQNTVLRVEKKIDSMKNEILDAIKENNN